jgi:hypothetical protein
LRLGVSGLSSLGARPFSHPLRTWNAQKPVISAASALAFTLAPHLQIINHRGRFSPFVGI